MLESYRIFYKAVTANRFLGVCYEGSIIVVGKQEINFQIGFILKSLE